MASAVTLGMNACEVILKCLALSLNLDFLSETRWDSRAYTRGLSPQLPHVPPPPVFPRAGLLVTAARTQHPPSPYPLTLCQALTGL